MQLSELLAAVTQDGAVCSVAPPDDWRQGRTLYGGLTAALSAHAAARLVPDLPPLRALQIAYVGPATGHVRFAPALVRRGRSAAFLAVDATGDDGPCARATLTYGSAREANVVHDRSPAPSVAPPASCEPLPTDRVPAFLAHFDARFAAGGVPFSGGEPAFCLWVRHRDDGPLDPAIALVAVGDVLPPAAAAAYRAPAVVSSMTWSLDVAREPPPAGWYLLSTSSDASADGYSQQTMGCWDECGHCLALGRQTVALF